MNDTPTAQERPAARGRTALLHLDSSADTAADSTSRRLTALFAREWRKKHGADGGRYRYRDLAAAPVPQLSSAYTILGRRVERHGVPREEVAACAADDAERREWELTRPLVEEVLAAGTVLLGVPMYNFTVPAALKAWIDRVTFPGAFTGPDGPLLRDTRVVVVCARGGGYGPGTPREGFDFQEPYLRAYFGNLGVPAEQLHMVTAELTRAALVPEFAPFAPLAEDSLVRAEAALAELAAGAVVGAAAP